MFELYGRRVQAFRSICVSAGSFLKGKPRGVKKRIAFKVCTWEAYVCVIILNGLVLGNGICAFIAGNSSMRFNLKEMDRDR